MRTWYACTPSQLPLTGCLLREPSFLQALPAYTQEFKVFQDENDTAPFEEIKNIVEDAIGCPLAEVFESFDGAEPNYIVSDYWASDLNVCGRDCFGIRINCPSSQGSAAARMGC